MMHSRMMVGVITLCFIANVASAQVVERTDSGLIQFADAIVGKWEIDKVVASGNDVSRNYGPSTFTRDSWTIQTKNGDHVYELSHVNEFSGPLEATFVNVKHRALSFAAFILLEDEKLSIIRGSGLQKPILLPETMQGGPETIVYTFKKSAVDETVTEEGRTPLKVRLIEVANAPKVLVDVTIRPYFGGKLRYSSERLGARAEHDYSPKTGTVIIGAIEPTQDGKWAVSLIIEIGSKQHSDDPESTIVRSEKLKITTVVTAERTVRIKCGDDRMCELTLK